MTDIVVTSIGTGGVGGGQLVKCGLRLAEEMCRWGDVALVCDNTLQETLESQLKTRIVLAPTTVAKRVEGQLQVGLERPFSEQETSHSWLVRLVGGDSDQLNSAQTAAGENNVVVVVCGIGVELEVGKQAVDELYGIAQTPGVLVLAQMGPREELNDVLKDVWVWGVIEGHPGEHDWRKTAETILVECPAEDEVG